MPSRTEILSRVRQALADLPPEKRTPYPDWPDSLATSRQPAFPTPWDLFVHKHTAVNGQSAVGPAAAAQLLRAAKKTRGYCDPDLLPVFAPHLPAPEFTLSTEFDRTRIDDYAFGITRASGCIAETGTIILNDVDTSRRLGALAPWVHIAVITPETIFPNVITALQHLGTDPNIVWATGPSKTADVEGILIEGVHGPGVQIACLLES